LESTSVKALVVLKDISYRLHNRIILNRINWRLEPGQHWGVLGGNGAGKSTFLRLVRGEIWPQAGIGSRVYCLNGRREESPLAFRQASALVSSELLDRYQRRQWNLSVLETVCTGFAESVYLYEDPGSEQLQAARKALDQVGLDGKEREPLLRLSRGQIKRVLLARALVRRPRVLILDEAFEDLDHEARAEMFQVLAALAKNGVNLLYATHRQEELLPALSHVLVLENGRISRQGPRQEILPDSVQSAVSLKPGAQAGREIPRSKSPRSIVTVSQADLFRERRRVLRKIDWTVELGQSWALLGPNGAGKTSLLMLLAGELSPALGGRVTWFGNAEHSGLWQLRAKVGLVSGDLQARHKRPRQTGLDTVISGLQGSIGISASPGPEQIQAAQGWLRRLGIAGLAERAIATLSYGEMRKLLIARAMVSGPKLLLLDEPMAGLDQDAKTSMLEMVERLIKSGVSLVMVSHHAEDLPPSLTHVAELSEGRLVFQGSRSDYMKRS